MKKKSSLKKSRIATVEKKKVDYFPVVAIGASLGGLKAVSVLFQNLPVNTGMAFIYVQHLSIDHKSFLTTILAKTTNMSIGYFNAFVVWNNIHIIRLHKFHS